MNRRAFVRHAAAAASAWVASTSTAAPEKQGPVIPIIDTHQHIWDLDKFRLAWLQKDSPLAKSFLMNDYFAATKGLNVVKTVYMEVDVVPEQQQAEAECVIDLCKRADNPMAAAVISGRPASAGFAKYITAFKNNAYIKGVRQVLHGAGTPAGYCLDKAFIQGVRLLGELGMSFDLCIRPAELPDAAKLVDACPDTRFILDHCGNPDVQAKDRTQWQRDIAELAKRKHVLGKISGVVESAKPEKWTAEDVAPFVNHTLDAFGPDRVVFAANWPVCNLSATFARWVEALQHIVRQRKVEDQKKLFHDNAVRVYGLA